MSNASPTRPAAAPVAPVASASPAAPAGALAEGDRLALSKAAALLRYAVAVEAHPASFERLVSDPRQVNADPREENARELKALQAAKKLGAADRKRLTEGPSRLSQLGAANEGLAAVEAQALAAWPAADAKAYEAIAATLGAGPQARLALRRLLLEGKLPGPTAHGGQTLLATLAAGATQPLAEGLVRGRLMGELLQELAEPTAIDQRQVGTCVATTAQIFLARSRPAEYARLVFGLASPSGEVKTAGNKALQRQPAYTKGTELRTLPSSLFQAAAMRLGDVTYDSTRDTTASGLEMGGGGGLYPSEAARMFAALIGQDVMPAVPPYLPLPKAWEILEKRAAEGGTPVAMDWEGGGHQVLVTSVNAKEACIANPQGYEACIPRAAFEPRLKAVLVPR